MYNNKKSNKLILMTILSVALLLLFLLISKNQRLLQQIEAVNTEIESEEQQEVFEIWSGNDGLTEVLQEIIDEYRKQYPDIKIILKTFKPEVYSEALLNAAVTNSLPDMFYTWGDKGLEELVDIDVVKDLSLSSNCKDITKEMVPGALSSYTFENKIYGLPSFGWNLVLYCNKELFDECCLEYPSTYEAFLETVKVFKSKEITPLSISGNEGWMASLYFMSLSLDEGSVFVSKQISANTKFFRLKPFVSGAKLFKELLDLAPWEENYTDLNATESMYKFIRGEEAMLLSGSWCARKIDDSSRSKIAGKVKVIPFPITREKVTDEGIAGFSDGFALNKQSTLKNRDIDEFYFKLMKRISDKSVLEKGMGLPVYISQDIKNTRFSTLKSCYELFPKAGYHAAYDKLLPTKLIGQYNEAILAFMRREIGVEGFIRRIMEAQKIDD